MPCLIATASPLPYLFVLTTGNTWKPLNLIAVLEYTFVLVNKSILMLFSSVIRFKVGSYDPVLVQLSFQIFSCLMKNADVHTIQFSHLIISWCTPEKHDNSCFENLGPFHRS